MYVFIWILTGGAGAMAMIGAAHWIARAKPRAVSHTPLVAHAKQSLETRVARWESSSGGLFRTSCSAKRSPATPTSSSRGGSRSASAWRTGCLGSGQLGLPGNLCATLFAWIGYNVERPGSFDPFPFILLNLVLSCLAAVQAPVILMSQNRMSAKDRVDARRDSEVNQIGRAHV